jgi:trimethylamine corrinoid protein
MGGKMAKSEVTKQNILGEMTQAVVDGDQQRAAALAKQTSKYKLSPLEAIEEGFVKGLNIVGQKYQSGEFYLPELITSSEAMKKALETLEPQLKKEGAKRDELGKVVIGAVEGDIHDIGYTIVATMLYVAGFEVIDVGRDAPVRTFIQTAQKENADIIAASALMTTTMAYMPELIKQLTELGIRDKFKVMVGGAPTSQRLCDKIGADGYGANAREAVAVAKELISGTE